MPADALRMPALTDAECSFIDHYVETLTRALRVLDGERRAGRITLPPAPS